jgi:Ser/Thr protein kinase RdoA (MazF antagonist)
MLAALHTFRPSPTLAGRLLPSPLPPRPTAALVVGRAMIPWPDGVGVLLANAVPAGAPPELVAETGRLLRRDAHLGPALDAGAAGVVHGDLHLQNVWCDGRRVTGLLDLEWARRAPSGVELARVLDEVDQDVVEGRAGHAELLAGLRRHLVQLVAVDRLPARLRLLRVAHQLRQLAVWPTEDAGSAPPDHPVRRLAELVGGP